MMATVVIKIRIDSDDGCDDDRGLPVPMRMAMKMRVTTIARIEIAVDDNGDDGNHDDDDRFCVGLHGARIAVGVIYRNRALKSCVQYFVH